MQRGILIEKSGDVDACVAFSRDVGISVCELAPDGEELPDCLGIELGDDVVVPGGRLAVSVAEADLGGRLDVYHVGLLVPGVLVVDEGGEVVVDEEGAVFVESA